MFRKIFFGIFIALILSGGSYYFVYLNKMNAPVSDAINAIPPDASLIIESNQSLNLWRKLSQTNIMWEELLNTETIAKLNTDGKFLDSVIKSNEEITELLKDHPIAISFHNKDKKSLDILYVFSLPNITYQSTIEEFLKNVDANTETISSDYVGTPIFSIIKKNKSSFNFAFQNGTFLMSENQTLVEAAIRQLKSGKTILKNKYFNKVISSAGKNVDANIYVNYKYIPTTFSNLISKQYQSVFNQLSNFAHCSGWDFTLKPNSIMLNGFTEVSDSNENFLKLFVNQKPQKTQLVKVVPSKTALLLYYGVSNIKLFYDDFKKYRGENNTESYFNSIKTKYNLNIQSLMLDWMGNELAMVLTQPSSESSENNSFAVVRANNTDDAVFTLNSMVDSICKVQKIKNDTSHFKNHIISFLDIPDLFRHLFGKQFENIKNNYFTTVDDYIVFSNTDEALRNYINDFEFSKTLANDKNYKTFSDNISSETNFYIYSAIARSQSIYNNFLSKSLNNTLDKNKELLRKFEGVAFQFSSNGKSLYSNIYLKFNPQQKQESSTLWECKLDTSVSSKPYLVTNHLTNGKEVFVQDDENKIYLISNTGKIIWSKKLDEKIMSEVTQIDVLKNNKLQLLFNTRSAIYLFDRNGNDMKGFPIKLKSAATNSISISDYDNNKDYRLFIATENKKIICYKATGEQVTGFSFDKTSNNIQLPIKYFNINGKDHLCAIDKKGKIYIIERKGEMKIKMKEHFAECITNYFVESGKDNSSTYIIATDTLGHISKINLSNNKENVKLQEFETTPYADFKDMDNDDLNEFIFLTRNQLSVFSQNKTMIFNYQFKDTITQSPQYYLFPDLTGKIGVVSETSNKIYLIDDNGSMYNGFPLTGKTQFAIGDLNNDGSLNVVVGSADNSIYLYQIE